MTDRRPLWYDMTARLLNDGGVIAYPTEAVLGLGCDPFQQEAVERIISIKGRALAKGMIVLIDDRLVDVFLDGLPNAVVQRIKSTWPGPVTWLIPHRGKFPAWVTGGRDTVAVRCTAHPVARWVTRAAGGMVVSTSANRSGQRPARYAWQIPPALRAEIDAIIPGSCGIAKKPSTIRDALSDKIIRA